MANNNFDEVLRLIIKASGNDELKAITKSISEIADSSSEAAPHAKALLDEFTKLANESSAIDGFVKLKAQLTETDDKLAQAKAGLAALSAEFDKTDTSNRKISASFKRAETDITKLTAQHNRLSAQLAVTSTSLVAAGIDTERLDSAQRDLQASISVTAADAGKLAATHTKNSAAAEKEAISVETLAKKYSSFARIVENIKAVLATFAGLFALEKAKESIQDILETGDKFQKFGVDFANAFGGAEPGAAALEKIKELADQVPLSLDEVAAAALRAKREGFDPLDGSLKTFIDTNAKYGGSAQDLNRIIDTLGRTYAKGTLQIGDLQQLQQVGIPVAKELGIALGKTSDEVLNLAQSGQLGRESIKLLIDQLGRSSSGDAAEQMSLLGSIAAKVKDQWEEFLNLIGESGVYDFVRDKLKSINVALHEGLGDGSLKAKAQAISDALVHFGQAVAGTLKFLYDHAQAIYSAVKAYAVLRATMLTLDLASVALKFAGLTTAVRTSEAAAAAAAAPTGGFGRLVGALKRIPRQILVGIAVAVAEKDIEIALHLYDTLSKIRELNKQQAEQHQEDSDVYAELGRKAGIVAAQLAGYAKTQIEAADVLAGKNRSQSEEYIAALQNATRYYTALRVQAREVGDIKGVADATEHLKLLGVAIGAAADHLKTVNDSLKHTSEAVGTVVDRFDQLGSKGESAAASIEGAFDKIEIQTPQGLDDLLTIIRQVSIRSGEAKTAVQSELVGALAKLDASDLRNFQQNITQRLRDAKDSAGELKTALGAALEAELLQLGLSAEQAGVKFTEGGQKIIDTFSNIANNAQATAGQIQLAFAKALSQASTEGEVQSLQERLQRAFDAGKISADQFGTGAAAAGRKLADIQTEAAQAGAALDGMGKDGESASQRISASLQDTRDKLIVQANEIAAAITAALNAGDNAKADTLRAQFKGVDAQIQDLNGRIEHLNDDLDKTHDRGDDAAQALARMAAANFNAAVQANIAADNAQAAASKAEQGYTEWGDAADAAALATQGITADTSHANDGMAALAQGIADARSQFLSISDAAAKFYDTVLKGSFEMGHSDNGSGFDQVADAMQKALDRTNDEIAEQRNQLQNLTNLYNETGQAGTAALDGVAKSTGGDIAAMQELSDQIQNGTYKLGLLGQADLGPLQQALDGAIARTKQLQEQAAQADAAFNSLADSTSDAFDQATGNTGAIEDRRHQKTLDDLKDAAAAAGKLGSQQYRDAVDKENKLHELKLKNIKDEQDAANPAKNAGGSGSGSARKSTGAGAIGPHGQFQPQVPVAVNYGGRTYNLGAQSPAAADTMGELLMAIAVAKASSI